MKTGRQFCTFHLDKLFLGIEVESVQEIIRPQNMTPVPLAPKTVAGLINLRGQILPALDLRSRFGLPPRNSQDVPANIVVRSTAGAISILVDKIGDVVSVPAESFEPPPEMLSEDHRSLIPGAYKLERSLMLHLDITRAIDICQ